MFEWFSESSLSSLVVAVVFPSSSSSSLGLGVVSPVILLCVFFFLPQLVAYFAQKCQSFGAGTADSRHATALSARLNLFIMDNTHFVT